MVAFRPDGSDADDELGAHWHSMPSYNTAQIRYELEVETRISCQELQNSRPVAKTFSFPCRVPQNLEQVIDKALNW